jgi:hypothetical protein
MHLPSQEELLSFKTTFPFIEKSYPNELYPEVIFTDGVVDLFRKLQQAYSDIIEEGYVDKSLFTTNELARTLNFAQAAIHHNNTIKGWHNPKRELGTMMFLIVTELAEAMEEYRNGKPAIYQNQGDRVVEYGEADWNSLLKPEGIAVEMADAGIRLLDTCGALKYEMAAGLSLMDNKEFVNYFMLEDKEMGSQLMSLAFYFGIIRSFDSCAPLDEMNRMAASAFVYIIQFCSMYNLDLGLALKIKDRYNRTRSHRHGGKVC